MIGGGGVKPDTNRLPLAPAALGSNNNNDNDTDSDGNDEKIKDETLAVAAKQSELNDNFVDNACDVDSSGGGGGVVSTGE